MNNPPAPKLYIAAIGMTTPVGANTAMTAAMVRAEMNVYTQTDYTDSNGYPITMASVPDLIFDELDADIGPGDKFDARHYRVIKMAIIAIRQACTQRSPTQPIPLVMAMHEAQADSGPGHDAGLIPLIEVLEQNCKPWISAGQYRRLHSGRAAGMEAIDFGFRYLYDQPNDYFLIGGADSYRDDDRLALLGDANRLKVPGNQDGFAPGEAACFLLLTHRPELALVRHGHLIALNPPGIAEEPGHLHSKEPYRGDGLDQAFKKALVHRPPASVQNIYSSMNGENHWAKEYGVAYTRNQEYFRDPTKIEHPADCFGDLGAATAPVLIALAAEDLLDHPQARAHLVYSSSDGPKRGALVVEKIAVANAAAPVTHHPHPRNF